MLIRWKRNTNCLFYRTEDWKIKCHKILVLSKKIRASKALQKIQICLSYQTPKQIGLIYLVIEVATEISKVLDMSKSAVIQKRNVKLIKDELQEKLYYKNSIKQYCVQFL